jgi:hypothetical protein
MEIRNVSFGGGLSMVLTPAVSGLFTAVTNIVEGNSFTITFTTNKPGSFGYTITGVSSADIGNASLTGTFTANGETRTYTISDDLVTEGAETFVMSLDNGQARAPVVIDDAYYTLTANVASVNEYGGNVFNITLDTNAIHALPLGYTITGGVSSIDFIGSPSLTGNFTSNGQVLTFTANADLILDGVEYFTISLDNGRANANVIINDTSVAYYTLTANRASVNEGNSFTVTFVTNALSQLPLGYTITGVSSLDFDESPSLTGNLTANNQVLTFTANSDLLTEGTEYFAISLNNGQANANVLINDTSNTGLQIEFTTPGTYTWYAPTGVTSISVVAVGGGGGGGHYLGGGGGALAYKTSATVIPGTAYSVVVGAGGANATSSSGISGGYSSFGSNIVYALGGFGAYIGHASRGPGGNVIIGDGGGYGGTAIGMGGAGAAGYSGNGGDSTVYAGLNGSGGGGGGSGMTRFAGGGGGGVGIYGEGASGLGGSGAYQGGYSRGQGGSGGLPATNIGVGNTPSYPGGLYGGGGGGQHNAFFGGNGLDGAKGAVRIIWGAGRSYPSTNTANVY